MGSALPGSLCLGVGVDRRMVTAGSGDRVIGDCETGTNIPMMVTESAGWTHDPYLSRAFVKIRSCYWDDSSQGDRGQ